MTRNVGNRLTLLSVEDNPGDRLLIRRHFQNNTLIDLYFVEDGQAAMDFLHKKGVHSGAPTPHLLLLDLNLQKKDGRQVLAEVKSHPLLKDITVFILTTSRSQDDKDKCLALGAARYFTKPNDLKAFDAMMAYIEAWLKDPLTAPPPPKNGGPTSLFKGLWKGSLKPVCVPAH